MIEPNSIKEWQRSSWEVAESKGWHKRDDEVDALVSRLAIAFATRTHKIVSSIRSSDTDNLKCLLETDEARQSRVGNRPSLNTMLFLVIDEACEAIIASHAGMSNEDVTEELVDIMLRIFDLAEVHGLDLDKAIRAKHEKNKGRPHRHGGKLI
jgi:NTP pyrophosphatase (non-canonical NTP hydrolase)